MYLNKVMLIGNLTRDPELKSLPSGTQVASLALATNRTWKDKNGQKQEDVQYHNVVVFARQAEIVGQYLRKGSSAYIEGRLQTRSWDAADGQKKYRTEVVADRVQFGPRPPGQGVATGVPSMSQANSPTNSTKPAELETIEYPEEESNVEDIPF